MPVDDSNEIVYQCAFCGKGKDDVGKLIGSPNGVFICDVCVSSCVDLMNDETSGTPVKARLD